MVHHYRMPVSTSVHITHCLRYIITLRPRSILDIGCGFGMWGFLSRMYLDVAEERVQPETWRTRIDGIELFEPYIQSHQRALYSSIRIGDIRALAGLVDRYDLIIAGDVIEHLDKPDGERVIEQLYDKADKALLVNIPLGEGWEHPERHGNPGELHRSQWYIEDFYPYPSITETFTVPAGAYGSFYCPKDCRIEDRVEGLLALADRRLEEGRDEQALHYAQKALELAPMRREAVFFLTDFFLRRGETDRAIEVLQSAVTRDPSFHYAHVALAKILFASRRHQEVSALLTRLLQRPDLDPEIREQAQSLLAQCGA